MAEQQQEAVVKVPRRRTLPQKPFAPGQNVSMDLPLDCGIVGLFVRFKGTIQTTYTGTPAGRPEGAVDSLIRAIEVKTDRLGTVKYMRPHFLHLQQLMSGGAPTERLYGVGASAAAAKANIEGPFTFGTTGQYTAIDETLYLPFEQVFCEPGFGREETWLNTQRGTSATIQFQCNPYSALIQNPADVANVTFANPNFEIEVTTVERGDVPANAVFKVWRQIQKTEDFASAVNDRAIMINTENKLSGIMLYATDGATGANAKAPSNDLLKFLKLRKNGRDSLQEISFRQLQNINRSDYGVVAPFAAGVSRLQGFAHLTQLSRRELASALDVSKNTGGVYSLQLMVDTNDNSLVSYTQPASLHIVTEEIVNGK